MLIPILVSSIFVLAVVILCLRKPNAGRIFLGIFFLIMAVGVNGAFTFFSGDLIPLYRDIALAVVELNPVVFGLLVIIYEIVMGLLLLHKGKSVRIGLIGTMLFLVGISPLSYLQIPWLGLIIGEVYLLTQDFNTSFMEIVRSKLGKK